MNSETESQQMRKVRLRFGHKILSKQAEILQKYRKWKLRFMKTKCHYYDINRSAIGKTWKKTFVR